MINIDKLILVFSKYAICQWTSNAHVLGNFACCWVWLLYHIQHLSIFISYINLNTFIPCCSSLLLLPNTKLSLTLITVKRQHLMSLATLKCASFFFLWFLTNDKFFTTTLNVVAHLIHNYTYLIWLSYKLLTFIKQTECDFEGLAAQWKPW